MSYSLVIFVVTIMSVWDFDIYEINKSNFDSCRADPVRIRSKFINVVPAVVLVRTGTRSSADMTLKLNIGGQV